MMRWELGLLAVTLAACGCAVGAVGYTLAAAASNGGSQCLPLPAVTPSSSPSASVSSTSLPVLLCVIVNPSQSSVQAGRDAGFVVQVQVQNGAAPDVSVTLTASAGHAVFTGLCPSGDGAASCQLGPLGTDVTPSSFTLHAQIGTPSSGTTRVSLTAAADAATNPSITAQATGTTTVTTAASKTPGPTQTKTPPSPSPLPGTSPQATVRAVIPNLGGLPATAPVPTGSVRTSTAPAGNISSLFPVISPDRTPAAAIASPTPADTPSPGPVDPQASGGGGKSLLTITSAVVLGLLAIALAGFLITTRRRRADE
jgi:hypothetical protein